MKINLRYLRYGLFFVAFLILIFAVQVFVQNFNINKTIKGLEKTQNNLSGETLWMETYHKSFLNSKYAIYFFKHKQGVRFDDEILVKIEEDDNIKKDERRLDKYNVKNYNQSVRKNWNGFFYNLRILFIKK